MTRWIIELSQTTKIPINPIYIPPAKFNRSCGRNKKCCFSMQLMLRLKIGCTKSSRQWIVQVAALQIIWDIFGQFQSLWKFPQHPLICWKLFLLAANIPPTGKLNAAKVELWWIVEVGASRCNFLHSSPPEISWITNFSCLQVLQLQPNEDDHIKLTFSESSEEKMPLLSPAILPLSLCVEGVWIAG